MQRANAPDKSGSLFGRPALIALLACLLIAGFVFLGNWQLERREWKLQLIERVGARVHSPAQPAPTAERWAEVRRQSDEYRNVAVSGRFLPGKDVLVVAATALGSGYWVLSPFKRIDGAIVFVNRGYIGQRVVPAAPPAGEVQIRGLLRMSEPEGSPLRANEPSAGRWYSRDIEAMSREMGLVAAPYFIDAAAGAPGSRQNDADSATCPVGGLTVITFHNNHLVYALTWYGLAAMVVIGALIMLREGRPARES